MLTRFREAMTPERVEALAEAVNAQITALLRHRDTEAERVKVETLTLEREAGRRVRFVAREASRRKCARSCTPSRRHLSACASRWLPSSDLTT